MRKNEILEDIEKISSKNKITKEDMEQLSVSLERLKEIEPDEQISDSLIFDKLEDYKADHTLINLQKLCVEISDFCCAIYSSTANEQEREIYCHMIEQIKR